MSQIKMFAEKIKNAKKIVVLTGSGVSVASGIPDFRSKTGIYQENPEYLLSLSFFKKNPQKFYDFLFESLYFPNAEPNDAHKILKWWEGIGKEVTIITQNIDNLHQKAGSNNVVAFHGNIATSSCMNSHCRSTYDTEKLRENRMYICPNCNKGLIKPNIVLYEEYGEWMKPRNFQSLLKKIDEGDLLVVLGTTLVVYTFASLANSKPRDRTMLVINNTVLEQEVLPNTYAIHADISQTLLQIQEEMVGVDFSE